MPGGGQRNDCQGNVGKAAFDLAFLAQAIYKFSMIHKQGAVGTPKRFLLLLILTLPSLVNAQFTFTTNNGAITITGYTGPGGAVTIPSTLSGWPVTSVGTNVFQNNSGLTSITIPNGVTNIGDFAFNFCVNLNSAAIPNSIAKIGKLAFGFCYSLTNVVIPDSVVTIGVSAFNGCKNLTNITVDPLNSYFSSMSGVLFEKNLTALIQCPGGKTGSYIIPNGVTTIVSFAFYSCYNLTNITIPSGVTNIGYRTFEVPRRL